MDDETNIQHIISDQADTETTVTAIHRATGVRVTIGTMRGSERVTFDRRYAGPEWRLEFKTIGSVPTT